MPSNLCRKREGSEGGGGREYHLSLLPEMLQSALHAEISRDVVLAAQKQTRRDLKQIGTSAKLPSFQQFIDACNNAISAYNAKSHSSLPDKMSPDQYWEYHVSTGFETVPVLDGEKDDLFRQYVRRKTHRAMVEWLPAQMRPAFRSRRRALWKPSFCVPARSLHPLSKA